MTLAPHSPCCLAYAQRSWGRSSGRRCWTCGTGRSSLVNRLWGESQRDLYLRGHMRISNPCQTSKFIFNQEEHNLMSNICRFAAAWSSLTENKSFERNIFCHKMYFQILQIIGWILDWCLWSLPSRLRLFVEGVYHFFIVRGSVLEIQVWTVRVHI